MKDLMKQSISHAITENFKIYEEDYPLQDGGPTDEGISQLVRWVENEYEANDSEEKGTINEWFEVAKTAISNYFDWNNPYLYDEEEREEIWNYIEEQVKHIRKAK